MIDYFLGFYTEFLCGGGNIMVFCHRRHAVVNLFCFCFKKDKSSHQYFITQGMGRSSMYLTF